MTKISPGLPVEASASSLPASAAPAVSRPGTLADPAQVAKSAHDFEAMAIGQLLQPMFDTIDSAHGLFGGGAAEEAWKPMLIQEFAKQITNHGGLGLARPIYDAMQRMQEGNKK